MRNNAILLIKYALLLVAVAPGLAMGQSPPAPAAPAATGTDVTVLPNIDVISQTPLQGSGLDRDRIPAQTWVVTSPQISRDGTASVLRALDEQIGGVTLDQAQDNPFQPNLIYRGFEASPLAGDAQGLAVYVNGTRFNSPFGDTVNWDLIPDIAVDRMDLVGSNPAFGLNALGGALSVQMKNGFNFQGGEVEVSGGSFGRVQGSFQYGQQAGNAAVYVAGTGLNEDGWRDFSPSQLRQFYGDVGWRNDKSEVHFNVTAADNDLVGNGTSPVQLLDVDRSAIYTYPDATRNQYFRGVLSGNVDVNDTTSLQGNAYYSNLSQRTQNGDAAEVEPCDDDATILCSENSGALTSRGGGSIPNFIQNSPYIGLGFSQFEAGGPYSFLNQTATDTNGYGAQLQVTKTNEVFGRPNQFVFGGSYDGGSTEFTASTLVGGFSLDRGYFAPDIFAPGITVDQDDGSIAPVRTHATNNYYGLFVADTLNITDRLAATVSGRFNSAQIDLKDQLGTALSGEHSYNRFNPAAGLTYNILPNLTAYFGYAESNRAPTPAELSCADPKAPCSLTNFFVGDPTLKQVVGHTFEAGLRGRWTSDAVGKVTWHAGLFRTESDDDILFVSSSVLGRAYFQNVGQTRRQGIEAGAQLTSGRLHVFADYSFTDATFQSPLTLSSESNPFADENGNIRVNPGNHLPGIPQNLLKLGADYDLTSAWVIGASAKVASGQYLFGDESNQTPQTGAYGVVSVHTSYQITHNIQAFGLVENAFNARYPTYGTFSSVGGNTPVAQVPAISDTRSLSPAAPIAGYAGMRVTF